MADTFKHPGVYATGYEYGFDEGFYVCQEKLLDMDPVELMSLLYKRRKENAEKNA